MKYRYLLAVACAAILMSCSDDSTSESPTGPSQGSEVQTPTDSTNTPAQGGETPADTAGTPAQGGETPADTAGTPAAGGDTPAAGGDTPAQEEKPVFDPTKTYKFYGAELTGKDQFHYGRFEARMKMAAISGTVSSMFLYYDNSWLKGEEPWNEIDIEILGKEPAKWQSNIITREADVEGVTPKNNKTSEKHHEFGFDATADFHLFGMVWTPEYISWEIDSVEVRRDTLGMMKGQVEFMTKEQSLRFNLWAANSEAWVGPFTGEGLPIEQHIDYVRVYSYDETTKEFAVLWQDDFDGEDLDSDHWSRGNWDMEKVKYRAQNVRVEGGVAKIIMDFEEVK